MDVNRIEVYEIIGRIGAGGMREVCRAEDTKLGRDLALKILPASPFVGLSSSAESDELETSWLERIKRRYRTRGAD